jgi:hypothetical protein
MPVRTRNLCPPDLTLIALLPGNFLLVPAGEGLEKQEKNHRYLPVGQRIYKKIQNVNASQCDIHKKSLIYPDAGRRGICMNLFRFSRTYGSSI